MEKFPGLRFTSVRLHDPYPEVVHLHPPCVVGDYRGGKETGGDGGLDTSRRGRGPSPESTSLSQGPTFTGRGPSPRSSTQTGFRRVEVDGRKRSLPGGSDVEQRDKGEWGLRGRSEGSPPFRTYVGPEESRGGQKYGT